MADVNKMEKAMNQLIKILNSDSPLGIPVDEERMFIRALREVKDDCENTSEYTNFVTEVMHAICMKLEEADHYYWVSGLEMKVKNVIRV